jgi:hypothetical protein
MCLWFSIVHNIVGIDYIGIILTGTGTSTGGPWSLYEWGGSRAESIKSPSPHDEHNCSWISQVS